MALTKHEVFEKYKVLYFEILDTILLQITSRFDDINKVKFVTLMDTSQFTTFSKSFPTDTLNSLRECYPKLFPDVKLQRLKSELQLIYMNEEYIGIESQSFIKLLSSDRDIFKEAYKLFSLILTLPSTTVTSVSVGGSFSCLTRINSHLRNSITEEGVTNLAKISIEKELLGELIDTQPFYNDIIDKFASLKDRKIDLIFKT